jgi:DNA polymerase III subunit gamma/tau
MDQFIVSARKYRPQDFSTVVGQAHITTTLRNAIRNKQLAHAFLFCGPRGVGKTTCARILAKTINCENLQENGEACNTCPSCVSFNNGSSMNIHELDAASNNSVDDIRNLTEQVRFAPQAGKYKVYIIDEVHMLSSSAFNAFLKTLEEPPSYAIFILATTEKHKILPTILSRCQIFDFRRITTEDTVHHLKEITDNEHIKAEKAALQVIAQKSEGCMRDALSILDKIVSFSNGELTYANTLEHLNILDEDYYFRLLDHMRSEDLAAALLLFDEINAKGFEGEMVLNGFAEFLRNLMVCKDERTAGLLDTVESFRERYKVAAKTLSLPYLISALNVLTEAEVSYKQARNRKLHVELALIKLTYLGQALELTGEPGEAGKKKRVDGSKALTFRQIPFLASRATPGKAESAKLTMQTEKISMVGSQQSAVSSQPVASSQSPVARPAAIPDTGHLTPAVGPGSEVRPTLGALQKIRRDIATRVNSGQQAAMPISEATLKEAWESYVGKLVEQKNHSAVTNFRLARLIITGEHSFEVITESNIQQKFIDQERAALVDHLKAWFNNMLISYQVVVEEQPGDGRPAERPLTMKEQYIKLIEQYPMVKELRDRLNLGLDY